jgi:predicted NBD/HSP70 family sugar kinase
MQTITTIGLDIAKSVFQVHGIDAEGNVLIRRRLKRRELSSQVMAMISSLMRRLLRPSCISGSKTSHAAGAPPSA